MIMEYGKLIMENREGEISLRDKAKRGLRRARYGKERVKLVKNSEIAKA